jgi:ZIP family zinc transporter
MEPSLSQWFIDLSPVQQAFVATCFTWFVTAVGAAFVFFFKTIDQRVLEGMLGFAAGVMLAAAYW